MISQIFPQISLICAGYAEYWSAYICENLRETTAGIDRLKPYFRNSRMNLVLDFGNTRIKAGLFNGSELVESFAFDSQAQLFNSLDLFSRATRGILGSVTREHEEVITLLPTQLKTMVFMPDSKVPLKNKYRSALTLGSDRMAASVGAWLKYPSRNVLTIDAGTCIKYNFVNAGNEYLGGAISPGIQMRLDAMSHFTHALPAVTADFSYNETIGTDSRSSLLSGAIIGAACEADGMISLYTGQHTDLSVVITGGDAPHLASRLKSRFFAHENLVLHGLNHILQINDPQSESPVT